MASRQLMLLIGAALAAVQIACGVSTPSVSEARAAFEKDNQGLIERGLLRVSSFSKTDGVTSEVFGVKMYEFAFKAQVEYPQGLNTECAGEGFKGWNCLNLTTSGGRVRLVGSIDDMEGKVVFRRTEQGWQPEGIDSRTVASRLDSAMVQSDRERRIKEHQEQQKAELSAERSRISNLGNRSKEELNRELVAIFERFQTPWFEHRRTEIDVLVGLGGDINVMPQASFMSGGEQNNPDLIEYLKSKGFNFQRQDVSLCAYHEAELVSARGQRAFELLQDAGVSTRCEVPIGNLLLNEAVNAPGYDVQKALAAFKWLRGRGIDLAAKYTVSDSYLSESDSAERRTGKTHYEVWMRQVNKLPLNEQRRLQPLMAYLKDQR